MPSCKPLLPTLCSLSPEKSCVFPSRPRHRIPGFRVASRDQRSPPLLSSSHRRLLIKVFIDNPPATSTLHFWANYPQPLSLHIDLRHINPVRKYVDRLLSWRNQLSFRRSSFYRDQNIGQRSSRVETRLSCSPPSPRNPVRAHAPGVLSSSCKSHRSEHPQPTPLCPPYAMYMRSSAGAGVTYSYITISLLQRCQRDPHTYIAGSPFFHQFLPL